MIQSLFSKKDVSYMKELKLNETFHVSGGTFVEGIFGLFIFTAPLIIGASLGYYAYYSFVDPLIKANCCPSTNNI
jgi:hypothetical protein